MTISAVVLVKNEQKSLASCLKSVAWCDEVIVIDDFSKDRSAEMARKHGAKVFRRRMGGDFAAQRNFGLEKARGEWVLFVDSDERVTRKLASEIRRAIVGDRYDGFWIRRQDEWLGRKLKYGEWGKIWLVRLARREAGRWYRRVHEIWRVEGERGRLGNELGHEIRANLAERLEKINRYSQIHVKEKAKEGVKGNWGRILMMPVGKFLRNYVWKSGWRDGEHGFVLSMMMSLHSFLAWSDLWLAKRKS